MKKDISIIIVSFNTKDLLHKCLKNLYENIKKIDLSTEIIVVDNDSKDGSVQMIEKCFPEVKIIKNNVNLGFGKANNIAMKYTDSNYYLLLNSDAEIMSLKDIELMHSFLEENKNIGILGPKVLNSNNTIQYSCRKFPSFRFSSFHSFLYRLQPTNPFSRYYMMQNWDHNSVKDVDWVSGCCMFIRAIAIKDIGFFDEAYFMYVEDVDLCLRMWNNGWRISYYPSFKVIHDSGASGGYNNPDILIEFYRSQYLFNCKRYAGTWEFKLRYVIKFGLTFRALLQLKGKHFNKLFLNFLFERRGSFVKDMLTNDEVKMNMAESIKNRTKELSRTS